MLRWRGNMTRWFSTGYKSGGGCWGWCMRLSWFRSFSRFTCLSSLWRLPGGESRTTFAPWRRFALAANLLEGRLTASRAVLEFFHFQLLEKAPPMEPPCTSKAPFCEKKVVKVPTKILRVSVHSDISNTQPSGTPILGVCCQSGTQTFRNLNDLFPWQIFEICVQQGGEKRDALAFFLRWSWLLLESLWLWLFTRFSCGNLLWRYDWVVATQILFILTPNFGEDEPILKSIFFKGVETTNQIGSLMIWVFTLDV